MAVQRYELFDHTLSVSSDVVVKSVALSFRSVGNVKPNKNLIIPRLLLEFVNPSIC
jgi:hypothetical protein